MKRFLITLLLSVVYLFTVKAQTTIPLYSGNIIPGSIQTSNVETEDSLTHFGSRENLLGKNPSSREIEKFSNELNVTQDIPPVFIVHAGDDNVVKSRKQYTIL